MSVLDFDLPSCLQPAASSSEVDMDFGACKCTKCTDIAHALGFCSSSACSSLTPPWKRVVKHLQNQSKSCTSDPGSSCTKIYSHLQDIMAAAGDAVGDADMKQALTFPWIFLGEIGFVQPRAQPGLGEEGLVPYEMAGKSAALSNKPPIVQQEIGLIALNSADYQEYISGAWKLLGLFGIDKTTEFKPEVYLEVLKRMQQQQDTKKHVEAVRGIVEHLVSITSPIVEQQPYVHARMLFPAADGSLHPAMELIIDGSSSPGTNVPEQYAPVVAGLSTGSRLLKKKEWESLEPALEREQYKPMIAEKLDDQLRCTTQDLQDKFGFCTLADLIAASCSTRTRAYGQK